MYNVYTCLNKCFVMLCLAQFRLHMWARNRQKYCVITDTTSYILSYKDMLVKYLGRGYHGVFPISSGICNVKVKQANTIS